MAAISVPTSLSRTIFIFDKRSNLGEFLLGSRQDLNISIHEVLLMLGFDCFGRSRRYLDNGIPIKFFVEELEKDILLAHVGNLEELFNLPLADSIG